MKGEGPLADLISVRFHAACKRLGLNRDFLALDCTQFRRPGAVDQPDLFGADPL
jgi:hypothetical protein